MRKITVVLSIGVFLAAFCARAEFPELEPVVDESKRRIIRWKMGDAAFLDLQRSVDAGSLARWETAHSTTTSNSFTCPEGEGPNVRYRLANPVGWKITVVDNNTIVGRFSSLYFTQTGRPSISYESDSPKSLKYAEFDGSKWQINVVDPCKAGSTSLARDPGWNLAIAYFDGENRDLKYAIRNNGDWLISSVDHEGMVGEYASLAFSPAGNPGISYLDSTNGDLKYAEFRENKWHTTTVDSEGFAGDFTSLRFTASGLPSISYRSEFRQSLKYAAHDGQKWTLTTVDKTGPTEWFTSLAIDKKGTPMIAYWSQLEKNPKLAVASDTGWQIPTVEHSRVLAAC